MYAVVGCGECGALWIVEGRPETTQCPRCRTRHRFETLKSFAETETSDAAARVRSAMLAERSEEGEFVDPAEVDVDEVGMAEAEFLSAAGLDEAEISAVDDRVPPASGGDSRSRKRVVLDAVEDLEEPTAAAIESYASEAGVPSDYVRRALQKLRQAGELVERDGRYRRV